jgi:hypothetical protein
MLSNNKDIDMLNLAQGVKELNDVWRGPSGIAPPWNTSVQFDATLVARLVAQHDELNARFATAVDQLDKDPETAERTVRECADQLHDLRRIEALRLYPVIARSFGPDPAAQQLASQSRLAMMGLVRRVLRLFDELVRAIRNGAEIPAAAHRVATALTEYRRRNEGEMYPMYDLMQRLPATAKSRQRFG